MNTINFDFIFDLNRNRNIPVVPYIYVPAGQIDKHDTAPEAEKYPAVQAMQLVAPELLHQHHKHQIQDGGISTA
jgi:hypothetical protein